MSVEEPIHLLIADDHTLFREGIRSLLLATPDIECVGEAATGEEAIQQAAALQPDVILMDVNMPGINGIRATRQILSHYPGIGMIIVTMLEEDASVFAAMRAGARGYVLKGAQPQELLETIRAVARGQALFGPEIARRVMNYFTRLQPMPADTGFQELTERELEILTLLAQHHTNPEIARQLAISPKTVRNYVSSIFTKLQVADRAEAIIRARDAGLT